MNAPLDPEALLRSFAAAGLRYVVIGGLAVNAYGVIRATKDLDICPAPDEDNLARLALLLGDLDAVQVAMLVDLAGVEVPVCSLAHLRAMKRAAGRPQDLQDLADLAIAQGDDGL